MIVHCYNDSGTRTLSRQQLRQNIVKLCALENAALDGEIRIIFVDDSRIQELNRTYLRHDYPTDVIAFSLEEAKSTLDGEVYISLERAAEQAKNYRVTFIEELWRLTIHGVLHLLGYNDQLADQHQKMLEKENLYLEKLDITKKES